MATKTLFPDKNHAYFCTFTCIDWIPLFQITNCYNAVYKWYDKLCSTGNELIGFVIMPNHVHSIINLVDSKFTINSILSNAKRFLAYEIIRKLEENKSNNLLDILHSHVKQYEKENNKHHRVFCRSSDIKPLNSEKLVLQKLNYLHNNPIGGKWNLCNDPVNYNHSSASFYLENNIHPNIALTHYKGMTWK